MSVTVLQLKQQIKAQIWVSGVPENLDMVVVGGTMSAMDALFQEAFAEIAKFCDCERANNVNVITFAESFYKCGMTVIPLPRGIVQRVYTIANGQWCDPVFLEEKIWPGAECMARNVIFPGTNTNPEIFRGLRQADGATDFVVDSNPQVRWPRARAGVYSKYDGNIYIAPWIQSNEMVVIEWRGIKTLWSDSDLLNPDQDYKKAVKLYIQYAYQRDYGDSQKAAEYKAGVPPGDGGFDQALGDLMWECRERMKTRQNVQCANERNRYTAELMDDVVPTPVPTPTIVADFDASYYNGVFPLSDSFTDTSTGTPVRWEWSFGDGSDIVYTQNTAYTYQQPGNYVVTLKVTNAGGEESVKAKLVTVLAGIESGGSNCLSCGETASLVPSMTGYTTPSGTVTTSDDSFGPAWNVFDDVPSTYWTSAAAPSSWVAYAFPSAKIVTSYIIKYPVTGTDGRPTNFELQGSNDGTTWTTLDSRTGISWDGLTQIEFSVACPQLFSKCRLFVTATTPINALYGVQIDSLIFVGCDP